MMQPDRAELIRQIQAMKESLDIMLDVLLPEQEAGVCVHPPHKVIDESTMGEQSYRCTQCGQVQDTPFHS